MSNGIVSSPAMESTPTVPIASSRRMSPAIIRWRRSTRSDNTPEPSNRMICGSDHAIPTAASAVGVFDSW